MRREVWESAGLRSRSKIEDAWVRELFIRDSMHFLTILFHSIVLQRRVSSAHCRGAVCPLPYYGLDALSDAGSELIPAMCDLSSALCS